MFTEFLGTAATAYGVLAALKSLLQTRQMLARRSSRDVSAGFLASYTGGYAIWLAYGLSTSSLPLIVVDTAGLLCAGLTIAVALSLRGALIRRAAWNSRNAASISQGPAAPGPQPCTCGHRKAGLRPDSGHDGQTGRPSPQPGRCIRAQRQPGRRSPPRPTRSPGTVPLSPIRSVRPGCRRTVPVAVAHVVAAPDVVTRAPGPAALPPSGRFLPAGRGSRGGRR